MTTTRSAAGRPRLNSVGAAAVAYDEEQAAQDEGGASDAEQRGA